MRPYTSTQKQILLLLFASSLLLLTASGCGVLYPLSAGGPYKGRVIDTETKQPLEGAVVLAVWQSVTPTVADQAYSYLDAEEVLTDSNGRFVVGKHPPMTLRPGWVEGPHITIYSPGYGFYPRYQVSPSIPTGLHGGTDELLRRMEKEEMIIELPRLTREERLYFVHLSVDDFDVPDKNKRNLLRLRNIEKKALGLPGDNEQGKIDTLILMNGVPDEKELSILRQQYKHILISKNGRYFNLDGTPSGIVYEKDLPVWVRELIGRMNYALELQTQLSEKPDVLEGNGYLPFCIKGKGSLIRTPDPVGKMHVFFLQSGWRANDRFVGDGHGSSSFVYEKEKHHCRILIEIDEAGTVPRKFGFEIYCREEGQE
ncbi:MAG: carboxypeptidase regulatory-like domain-containing protein [Nitrospirae bacterium]|nr:carboxypeptidase regulatory-like domain-containing protein [Nitrospirota bacterium]